MAVYRYQFYAQNERGDVIPGAVVTVRRESDSGIASIFSDSAGTIAKSNPFMCDDNGYGFFYVTPGYYRIAVSSGIYSMEWRDVYIGTAAIDALSDVQITGRTDNDVLRWSVSLQKWVVSKAREVLTDNRTYYVRSDGDNSNTGLANTSGGAFLTIQRALDVASALDLGVFNITINVANGTYAGATVTGPWVGSGNVFLIGNTGSPSSCVISGGNFGLFAKDGGRLYARGFKTSSPTHGLIANTSGTIYIDGPWDFGAAAGSHCNVESNGVIVITSAYTISAGADSHWLASRRGEVRAAGLAITLTGTPAFSKFCQATENALLSVYSSTFTGSATGARFVASSGAMIFVNGAGATYLPGNSAGNDVQGNGYV